MAGDCRRRTIRESSEWFLRDASNSTDSYPGSSLAADTCHPATSASGRSTELPESGGYPPSLRPHDPLGARPTWHHWWLIKVSSDRQRPPRMAPGRIRRSGWSRWEQRIRTRQTILQKSICSNVSQMTSRNARRTKRRQSENAATFYSTRDRICSFDYCRCPAWWPISLVRPCRNCYSITYRRIAFVAGQNRAEDDARQHQPTQIHLTLHGLPHWRFGDDWHPNARIPDLLLFLPITSLRGAGNFGREMTAQGSNGKWSRRQVQTLLSLYLVWPTSIPSINRRPNINE